MIKQPASAAGILRMQSAAKAGTAMNVACKPLFIPYGKGRRRRVHCGADTGEKTGNGIFAIQKIRTAFPAGGGGENAVLCGKRG